MKYLRKAMLVGGKPYQSIWDDEGRVMIIDQTLLPFEFSILELKSLEDAVHAIKSMQVRGAPLIGAAAAYGIYLAAGSSKESSWFDRAVSALASTRPTAINLVYALRFMQQRLAGSQDREETALAAARRFCQNEISRCRAIGEAGLPLLEELHRQTGKPVNILTHCNAGWIACIDYGTVTAPIYLAHEKGIPLHVWVSETRPRNQGARLTAWELQQQGVPCTIIADNASGHLLQQAKADIVLVGSDRTSRHGDVANKIGTYLKALAAKEHGIPFWVALPTSSIDHAISDGVLEIPIEERSPDEVLFIEGWDENGPARIRLSPNHIPAFNPAFDVTPAGLVKGLITEHGLCRAAEEDILRLLPDG